MTYREQVKFSWYHHILFWTAYVLFWSTRDLVHHSDFFDNIQLNLITTALYAILVYFNIYYLIPRFLLQRRYLVFLGLLLTSISATSFMSVRSIIVFLERVGHPEPVDFFGSIRGIIVIHFETVFVTLVTLAIIMVRIYMLTENDTKELIKKNLETELNFLKNQINPHFLFNTLNSIYFLIPKNQKKASEMVLQFSEMLSHQLYEGNKDFIPLRDEVKYLENYIDLEKVRQGDRVIVDWDIQGELDGAKVPPMIFLTFLENAFKHGQQTDKDPYQVAGKLKVSNQEIRFSLKNDMPGSNGASKEHNGVGLENAKRRLELLYPNHHQLAIDRSDDIFNIELTLVRDEN